MILISGNTLDPHVTSVAARLREHHSASVEILNPALPLPATTGLNKFDSVCGFDLQSVQVMWERTKISLPSHVSSEEDREAYLTASQWRAFVTCLASLMPAPVLNGARFEHNTKLSQLRLAEACGLDIPSFIIPSNQEDLLTFIDTHGQAIIKTLGYPQLSNGDGTKNSQVIMTSLVTAKDVSEIKTSDINVFPHFFQENLLKASECRVIATAERCMAYETTVHEEALTQTDWRYANALADFRPTKLSSQAEKGLRDYVAKSGLKWGVFDIINTTDGREVFLECNNEGQWYWLERDLEAPISHIIAEKIFEVAETNR